MPFQVLIVYLNVSAVSKERSYSVNSTTSYTETECLSASTDVQSASDINRGGGVASRGYTESVETITPPSLLHIFKQVRGCGQSHLTDSHIQKGGSIYSITPPCFTHSNRWSQCTLSHLSAAHIHTSRVNIFW